MPDYEVFGLVEVPKKATYRLSSESRHFFNPDNADAFSKIFYRASYLCTAATKVYGDGRHKSGCCRL
uniref:YagK/YfjJ domain-containing protein n=1 Tax=Pseudomonas turukhanskensis TaxID=1806536 RepID=UPI0035A25470